MRTATIEKFINYEVQNFVAMKLIDRDTNWGCFPRKAVLLMYVKSISLFPGEGNNISDMFGNRFLAWQHRKIILM